MIMPVPLAVLLTAAAALLAVPATILGHMGARGRRAPGVRGVKTAVTLLLLGAALLTRRGAVVPVLHDAVVVGLAAAAVADWLLAPVDNSRTFAAGLAAFLVAYLSYGVGLVAAAVGVAGVGTIVVVYLPVVAVGVVQYVTLSRVPSPLRVPVIAYVLVATNLLAAAIVFYLSAGGLIGSWGFGPLLLLCGAVSIYVSDSLIAHNLFRHPLPAEELWIMPTYYVGQVLVVLGLITPLVETA